MNADDILTELRRNAEAFADDNGFPSKDGPWGVVYLDNARPDGVTAHQFAGFLSALKARGLYRAVDNFAFGEVRMKDKMHNGRMRALGYVIYDDTRRG